jgi:hypothetical protein
MTHSEPRPLTPELVTRRLAELRALLRLAKSLRGARRVASALLEKARGG